MEIRVRLAAAAEAERLKTALYRFHEVRNFTGDPAPAIQLLADPAGLVSVVQVGDEAVADEFRRFWAGFRAESFSQRGLRDF